MTEKSSPQPVHDNGRVMRTAPARIWLNLFDTPVSTDGERLFPEDHEGVTWAEDEVGDYDVQYVRADLAAAVPAPEGARAAVMRKALAAIDALMVGAELDSDGEWGRTCMPTNSAMDAGAAAADALRAALAAQPQRDNVRAERDQLLKQLAAAQREVAELRTDLNCAHARIAAERDGGDKLRRALEVIAVGDAKDPVTDAGDELVALGYWDADALAAARAADRAAQPQPKGTPATWLGLDSRPEGTRGAYLVRSKSGQVAPWINGVIHNAPGTECDWSYGQDVAAWMPFSALAQAPAPAHGGPHLRKLAARLLAQLADNRPRRALDLDDTRRLLEAIAAPVDADKLIADLSRNAWEWGVSCEIDDVKWGEAGDSHNQMWRDQTAAAASRLQAALLTAVPCAAVKAEPIGVEAAAEVIETDDGPDIRWLVEGGIHALPPGSVLVFSHRPITDDDGSGEVYRASHVPVQGSQS